MRPREETVGSYVTHHEVITMKVVYKKLWNGDNVTWECSGCKRRGQWRPVTESNAPHAECFINWERHMARNHPDFTLFVAETDP